MDADDAVRHGRCSGTESTGPLLSATAGKLRLISGCEEQRRVGAAAEFPRSVLVERRPELRKEPRLQVPGVLP
jgi:hypothetical protein